MPALFHSSSDPVQPASSEALLSPALLSQDYLREYVVLIQAVLYISETFPAAVFVFVPADHVFASVSLPSLYPVLLRKSLPDADVLLIHRPDTAYLPVIPLPGFPPAPERISHMLPHTELMLPDNSVYIAALPLSDFHILSNTYAHLRNVEGDPITVKFFSAFPVLPLQKLLPILPLFL